MKYLLLLISLSSYGMGSINKYCKEHPNASICKPTDPVDPPPPPPPPVGDQITDPKYCTSFLFDNNETTTHRLLSDKVSQKDRDAFVGRLLKLRYNTISLQLVSNKEPSVQYDHSKMGFWRTELKRMKVDNKLKVVMWLRSDNAPKWSLQQWKDFVGVAISDLDDVVDIWTTGIENDEYWKESETKDLVAFMKSKTKKPVGVHTTPTLHHASYASTADMFMIQTGFGVSAAEVRDQLVGARKLFPNKEIMLAEYHKDGTSKEAQELCAQGLATNVPVGCMTGCAGRLSVTPPPPPPTTGCPAGGSKSNLIKPQSDNDGKLVLVLSCEYLKNTASAQVGSEKGRDSTNYTTLPNGARVHFRFSKAGSSYGNNTIKLTLKNGSSVCYTSNMGVRKEGWKFGACGSAEVPDPQPTKLYSTTGNSITLRQDFQDAVSKVDALVTINEVSAGNATSTAIGAARSGNTWTIPKDLSSYPRGNKVNTYRLRLSKVPPSGVTYHTSIMQTFVRETEIAANQGKTYPPTTRQ